MKIQIDFHNQFVKSLRYSLISRSMYLINNKLINPQLSYLSGLTTIKARSSL